jgi:Leucine-rich repeat (LRR) protein
MYIKTMCSLNISRSRITRLENLPDNLLILWCGFNEITKLENLPSRLQLLNCYSNKITKLEKLPSNLHVLNCACNKITNIENLPSTLKLFIHLDNPINHMVTNPVIKCKCLTLKSIVTDYILSKRELKEFICQK